MSDFAIAAPETRLQNFLERAGLRGFPWISAIVLYTISWGWLFIVRDSLWSDDWVMFVDFDFRNQGFAPWVDIQFEAIRHLGLTFLRTVIFISFLISSFFLFGVARQISFLTLPQRRAITLIFLLSPFNTARVALMVYQYTIGYLFFFLAWYLIVTFRSRRVHFLSVGLFFISFQTHSLLVFYLLPFLHLIFLSDVKNLRGFVFWLRKNPLLVSIPMFYWILRSIFWPERVPYHDISVLRATSAFPFVVFSLIIVGGLWLLHSKVRIENKRDIKILLSGFIALFLGLGAYVVLGFFKADWSIFRTYFVTLFGRSDWYSRHQTLQPLGVALLIVGATALLIKQEKNFKQVQVAVLSICVVLNMGFGFEYVVDYAKQKQIVTQLRDIGESKSISGYLIIDQTSTLNARGREYRYRDWYGLISLAYDSKLQITPVIAIEYSCVSRSRTRFVLIKGPETHWQALQNWASDGDMGFEVTVDDTPGACKPEMVRSEKVSGAIPILFYFTGAKN